MASLLSLRRFLPLLSCTALFVVGCASETSLVGELPSPNFSGPLAVQPAPRRIAVAPVVAPPVQIKPQAKVSVAATPKDWLPPVHPRSWQAIVIHHSATPMGGAARFDREHREKGWDELGYDFVIGNGTETGDGQVEVGSRWVKQKIGAHAKTPDNWYNEHGIGICLVGNFDGSRPSPAQMRSLARLVSFMMRTYHIPADHIVGHGDTKATQCPGRYLNLDEVRRMATQLMVAEGSPVDGNPRTAASREMLVDVKDR
jgi:N-acetylmuramoyl-L-alanine amidase